MKEESVDRLLPAGTAFWDRGEAILLRSRGWGARIFGAAALALGVIGLVRGDFTVNWHPVPESVPGRSALAIAAALIFTAAGLLLLLRGAGRLAGAALAILFLLLSTGWALRVVAYPHMIGTWLGLAEQIALATGAAAIAAAAAPAGRVQRLACRTLFGLCQLVFALGHFFALAETIAMTPAWLPPARAFWAVATGVIHLLGGLALLLGLGTFAVTRLLAVMFASFGLLVWLPVLLSSPAAPLAWAGNAINLALIGAVLSVGDALAGVEERPVSSKMSRA